MMTKTLKPECVKTMEKISSTNQDYLELIFQLTEEEKQSVRPGMLAKRLEVNRADVVNALRTLRRAGLVRSMKGAPVVLTEKGKFAAKRIHFLHHLVKTFLMETLNIRDHIAEHEACQIEHLIGNETVKAMINYLRNRKVELEHFDLDEVNEFLVYTKRLSELKVGDKAVIKRVEAEGLLKRRIMEMGVIKGDVIEVKGMAPMGDPIELRIGDYTLSLRLEEADLISVDVL